MRDSYENRVPPTGTKVILRDSQNGRVVAGWYEKGKGGWKILVELPDGRSVKIKLRELPLNQRG